MNNAKHFLVLLLMLSCFHGQGQGLAKYQARFWEQLSATCKPGLRWEKSITEFDDHQVGTKETKTFDLDCYGGKASTATQTIALNPDEFSHLFEFAFDNPYYSPYLDVVQNESGLVAKVKAGQEGDSKLHLQRFLLDATTGKLLEAEAHIVKTSPLYDLEVHVTVWFDAVGHYVRHEIETKADVFLGDDLHTLIQARLLP